MEKKVSQHYARSRLAHSRNSNNISLSLSSCSRTSQHISFAEDTTLSLKILRLGHRSSRCSAVSSSAEQNLCPNLAPGIIHLPMKEPVFSPHMALRHIKSRSYTDIILSLKRIKSRPFSKFNIIGTSSYSGKSQL